MSRRRNTAASRYRDTAVLLTNATARRATVSPRFLTLASIQEAEQRLREQQEVLAQRTGDLERRAVALKEANDLLARAQAAVTSARAQLAAKHDAR